MQHSCVYSSFRELLVTPKNLATLQIFVAETGTTRIPSSNLPGWRWAAIKKVALDRLSRSLHSDVCDSDGCCDAVVHSTISGSGNRRTRAVPNIYLHSKPVHGNRCMAIFASKRNDALKSVERFFFMC